MRFEWAETGGPGRIAIRPRPLGGDHLDGEMLVMKSLGVNVLVSLLQDHEAESLGLANEGALAQAHGIEFLHFPIVDHSVPESLAEFEAFASALARRYDRGENIVLHCFAGIGRSAMMAIATLVKAGVPMAIAGDLLSDARGLRVPETSEQYEWLQRMSRPNVL